jgi:MerR family Zn(II)-responsive transcriptional regulator of zntA
MKIGELAKLAGVSVQTVRFYERRRLMRTPRRTPAGYRLYNDSDLEIVRAIKRMQHFGFTLKEARSVLQLFALPGDTGKNPPYAHGSHECLREAASIGERKLRALGEQIQALVDVRTELEETLRQVSEKLTPPQKEATSNALPASSRARRRG